MDLEELYNKIENIDINDKMSKEELKELICLMHSIINEQNDIINEFKNKYIRLENNLELIEDKVQRVEVYKKLCDIILNKISINPISSWWFLYNLKKKILDYNDKSGK